MILSEYTEYNQLPKYTDKQIMITFEAAELYGKKARAVPRKVTSRLAAKIIASLKLRISGYSLQIKSFNVDCAY